MEYINYRTLDKIKNNNISDLSILDKRQIKYQILYDLEDIRDCIIKTRITKYGLYIYFKEKYKQYSSYVFISYRCFKDIENDYKVGIREILYRIKESDE